MCPAEYETGTNSFLDRFALTKRLEDNIEQFLADYGFTAMPYGHPSVVGGPGIGARLKRVDSKSSLPATMVKFSPDYIVRKDDDPNSLFFMDAKASITPVFFQAQVNRIKEHHGQDPDLTSADIGEIEREAWLSYNKFFPSNRVALFIAVPYHPRVLLGEWVSNITCMWCFKGRVDGVTTPWACDQCPIFAVNGGFGVTVNEYASGSGTPHVNINFKSMRTLEQFLAEEFDVAVDPGDYAVLTDYIKEWPLNKPQGTVSWGQFNGLIRRLKPDCPWLKYRIKDVFYDEHPSTGQSQLRF